MKRTFQALIGLIVVGYLLTGVAQIRPEERAVVRRFGKVVARPGPGLWIGFPLGIDQIDRVGVRTARQLEVGYTAEIAADTNATPTGQLLTGDQNLVNAKYVIEYSIDERDGGIDNYLANRDQIDLILARVHESLAAEWVQGRSVDEVLLAGRTEMPRWMMEQMPERLDPLQLGVTVQRISVDLLAPPDEVREAFERVNQAQTAIQTQEFQAKQQAAQRQREAEALQFRLQSQGEAYRQEKLSLAQAEATGFLQRLTQYRQLREKNPEILTAIWWDQMGKLLQEMKSRGRIDVIDSYLGKDGLDITQFLPPKKR